MIIDIFKYDMLNSNSTIYVNEYFMIQTRFISINTLRALVPVYWPDDRASYLPIYI